MIPRLIHQLWKSTDVPPGCRHWVASWQRLNPSYRYRLWTNSDLERLLEQEFPAWREIFWGYRDNICRIDLARCLILKRYGGIYADLDFECLRPQDELLHGRSLVLGLEPDSHAERYQEVRPGLSGIACNAWMASTPEHPFWDHLLACMRQSARADEVLDATGPFVLTQALESYAGTDVTVLESPVLYPVAKDPCWSGQINDLEFFEQVTRHAHAIHYWVGSWHRRGSDPRELKLPKIRTRRSDPAPPGEGAPPALSEEKPPLISCLMVTRGQADMVRQAIRGFVAQTYSRTELIVVTDAPANLLALVRSEFEDPRIKWFFLDPSGGMTLGSLRNVSIEHACGDYVAQWDDDDLHDPSRLQLQMYALLHYRVKACMLERWTVWWPERRRLFLSSRRTWEGTLLCLKSAMPRYPSWSRAEDTELVAELLRTQAVILMDAPRLYTYVVHGGNTWDSAHFESLYEKSSHPFDEASYERVLNEISRRVDVHGHPACT